MVVSIKSNKVRIVALLLVLAIAAGAFFLLRDNAPQKEQAAQKIPGATEEERLAYIRGFGWQTEDGASETREVMVPAEFSDVYEKYNEMQKKQGFDLLAYAGQNCTQYKYKVTNYPGEEEVYATLLVSQGRIIGGDISCSKVDGFMRGFAKDSAFYGDTAVSGAQSAAESEAKQEEPASEVQSSEEEQSESGEQAAAVPEADVYPTD